MYKIYSEKVKISEDEIDKQVLKLYERKVRNLQN